MARNTSFDNRIRLLTRLVLVLFFASLFACMFPAWSPDGTKVAFFHRNPDMGFTSRCLAVYDLSSATSIRLLELPEEENRFFGAAWHPNGRDIYAITVSEQDVLFVHKVSCRSRETTIVARFDDDSLFDGDPINLPLFIVGDRYLFVYSYEYKDEKDWLDCYRIDLKRKRIHKTIKDTKIHQVGDDLLFAREDNSRETKRIQLGRLNPKTLKTKVLCELPCPHEGVLTVIDTTPFYFYSSEQYQPTKAIHLYDMRGRFLKEIALESGSSEIKYMPIDSVPPYETLWMLGKEDLKDSTNTQWYLTEISLQAGKSRISPIGMSFLGNCENPTPFSSISPQGDYLFITTYYDDWPWRHLLFDLTRFGQEGWIREVPPPGD